MYRPEKYKFIVVGNKVIALAHDAGKTVRGVAICSESDTFDVEKGKELAAARCAEKVALRREKRAVEKLNNLLDVMATWQDYYVKATNDLAAKKAIRLKVQMNLNDLLDKM